MIMYSIEIDTVNRSHVSKNSLYTVLPQYKSFCNKITTMQLCVVSIQRASWCKELKSDLLFLCVNSFSRILQCTEPADAEVFFGHRIRKGFHVYVDE